LVGLVTVEGAETEYFYICTGADKFLALPIFLFAVQLKEFSLDGLKKLDQRSHKRVELRAELVG
jgi:hypothetical protein